jgi:hypothetical protein
MSNGTDQQQAALELARDVQRHGDAVYDHAAIRLARALIDAHERIEALEWVVDAARAMTARALDAARKEEV